MTAYMLVARKVCIKLYYVRALRARKEYPHEPPGILSALTNPSTYLSLFYTSREIRFGIIFIAELYSRPSGAGIMIPQFTLSYYFVNIYTTLIY